MMCKCPDREFGGHLLSCHTLVLPPGPYDAEWEYQEMMAERRSLDWNVYAGRE
jgi:hypothetical protein